MLGSALGAFSRPGDGRRQDRTSGGRCSGVIRRRGVARRSSDHGATRDVVAAVVLSTAAVAAALLSRAVSPEWTLATVSSVALAAVVVVSARHVQRLTRRLHRAEAREDTLAHQATHDSLTGLANRTLLFERLRLDVRRLGRSGGSIVVAYLDVDDLKLVNDSFGHAAGDRLLQAAAQRLTAAVRDIDTVARVGGDEFVVLASVDDAEAAERVIERLGEAAAPSLRPEGDVGLSLGWVLGRSPEDDPGSLVARADEAMYREKARRRGEEGCVWWPSVRAHDEGRTRIAACGCAVGYGRHGAGCHLDSSTEPDVLAAPAVVPLVVAH